MEPDCISLSRLTFSISRCFRQLERVHHLRSLPSGGTGLSGICGGVHPLPPRAVPRRGRSQRRSDSVYNSFHARTTYSCRRAAQQELLALPSLSNLRGNAYAEVNSQRSVSSRTRAVFADRVRVAGHLKAHENKKEFVCDKPGCKDRFNTKALLRSHLRHRHGGT